MAWAVGLRLSVCFPLAFPLDHIFPYKNLPPLHNTKSPAEVRSAPPSPTPDVPLAQPSPRRDPGEEGPLHRPIHLPVPSWASGRPCRALSRSRTSRSQAHEARRGTHPPLPSPSTSSSMHPAPGALRRRRPGSYRPPSGAPPPACPRPQAGPLPTTHRLRPLPRHGTPFGLRSPPRSGGGGGSNGCGGPRSTRPPFPWRPPPSQEEDSQIVANKSHLAKGEGGEEGLLTSQSPSPICAREAAGAREARAQTPRKLAFAAAALLRASLPPLSAPRIYLRPRPRPDPARNSTPLLHPRLPPSPSPRGSGPAPSAAPPYRSVPSPASAPNSPPAPTPRPVRRGLVSPSRRAPPPNPRPTSPPNSARSGFGPHPGHWSLWFGPVYGHPPRPCLGAGLARCLRPPSRPRRAVRVWVPVPASVPAALPRLATRARSTQDLNPRGVGAAESKFLYLPSAPAAGPRHPPPPTAPLHLGRAPRPLSQLCSSPRRRGSGRSERRREVAGGGAGIRPLSSGRTRGGGGEGGGGGRGGGPAVLGAPPASPGEAGTSPGSHRPRTGHEGRTEPPSPASPQLQEGGAESNAARGRRASVFARALCVTLYLRLASVYGGAWGLACKGRRAPAGRPAPSPAPHFPNPGDLGARLWRSCTEAARGRSPSPGAEVGQVPGKEKCRGSLPCLASPERPTLSGNLRCCKPPGLPSKDSPWPGRGGTFGGGCLEREARGRWEEGGGGG
uniref:basic proline-rich protein-like n=1 Tax=Nyctereutes procyonoides TaxID=34880 RepID=UPI002444DD4E|nr:basic proline-rich protein-like [Nyctereutes procyonoides]